MDDTLTNDNGVATLESPPEARPEEAPRGEHPNPPADRPKNKTAACRAILEESPDAATTEVIRACQARWGYAVTSNDISNAKASIREQKEKAKQARLAKKEARRQAAPTPNATAPLSGYGAEELLMAACHQIGVVAARAVIDRIEASARALLGQ